MPTMTPTEFSGAVPVDGYGPGFFRVGGVVHYGSVIVTPDGVQPWGGLDDHAGLLALAGRVDVLFLGMGAEIAFPPRALSAALEEAGVMAEPMNSPSAARSYNVTLSEGRRVACALIPL
ncbi:Mth938-like domain-containing protein [Paracoccus methylovorus]|uniref:Mth938-like domain-containing protein n=1 Tax=Paracoccus methylovorus TaxID=2812658 RepID=A0ABX7JIL0_9RHOB|nr:MULTISPECIES: Mth938-like domain-containing protein [Paracoccus]QRZ14081.1 Mth938-like domain-containing protein [Paracoccus methylovorus]